MDQKQILFFHDSEGQMPTKRKSQKKLQQKKYSTITQHKFMGKKLIPPIYQIGNQKDASWIDDRLPEMLWAILLITQLPRGYALDVFRQVAKYIDDLPEEDKFHDVTHTGISTLPPEHQDAVLSIITARQEQKDILVSLLLFEELPGRELWAKALNIDKVSDDWTPLMISVSDTLCHQTQESTDCRWLKVLCRMMAGKIKIAFENPTESKQWVEEILHYPNHGDPSKVGASIRAAEIGTSDSSINQSEWTVKFWDECLVKTPCFPFNSSFTKTDVSAGTTVEHVREIYQFLIEHTHNTCTTSSIDAKHDTVLGIGLYCFGLLQELLRVGSCSSISARTTLRTIAECYITLAYLAKKDDAELWQSYRIYGAGQAKLAFLKLDESTDEPSYVDVQTLELLANEDMWQEFLNIDLGHWDNTDLRKMSIEGGMKDVYDRFYGWTSTFAHGHWGAIRDTVFDTCGNPLHRFHHIPRRSSRALPDVVPDACELVDKILEVVSQLYPDFRHRVTLKI